MSKSDLSPIEKQVDKNVKCSFPHVGTPALVMGVSGGTDSMCLLHILHKLGIELHAVHINYQKRGNESDEDAALVEETAEKLGIDCEIITVNPKEAGNKNFQQWARKIRYSAFKVKAEAVGAVAIATAHHQDDQIETILQKVFRGGGLASWSGMQVWDGRLFRPLLEVSRDEVEAYCRRNEILFRTDESNLESDYARNFLRNQWLPKMQQHFPGWRTNILRIAGQAKIFESSMAYILDNITTENDCLGRKAFLELVEGLQKSVLIYYLQQVDETQEISRSALNELSKLGDLQTGKSIQLSETMQLMRDREHLKLVVDTGDSSHLLLMEKEEVAGAGVLFNGLEFRTQPYLNPDFKQALYLDTDSLVWPLRLRNWREGDRFQPLGMDGHQTVADHLTNRKISASIKQKTVVLETFEETICAVIFPPIENRCPPGTISELAKCEQSTRRCLTINSIS